MEEIFGAVSVIGRIAGDARSARAGAVYVDDRDFLQEQESSKQSRQQHATSPGKEEGILDKW